MNLDQAESKSSFSIPQGMKAVSFDVFDTLLVRPFLRPIDLFAFISPEVEKIIGQPIDFQKARVKAERQTRLVLPQFEDITIHEIYEHFPEIPKQYREAVKQLECQTERQLIYAKRSGKEIYEKVRASGLPTVAISDMYLEESFIREILEEQGFIFQSVYVSSRRRKIKHSGSMYQLVLKDLRIQPSELLHIGDGLEFDILPAQRLGIQTYHVGKNATTFFENASHRLLWPPHISEDPSMSALLGTMANELFDRDAHNYSSDGESVFGGSAYRLGYSWLGPWLLSFCIQLIQNAQDKKVLYFLSRDGWIIKQVYDLIAPYFEYAPESRYLYVSRKSTALAPIRSLDNMREKFGVAWFESTIREWITDRIGISIEEGDDDLVRRAGFSDGLESKINLKNAYQFQNVLNILSPRILARAKEERVLLFKYLAQEGVARSDCQFGNTDYRIGFVDIGYHGQTPRNIFQVTENYQIDLYFLVAGKEIFSLADEFGISIRGFYGEECRGTRVLDREWKNFFRHHKVFETFFITQEGSVKSYVQHGDRIIPECYDVKIGKEQRVAKEVHAGVVDFTHQIANLFENNLKEITPNPNLLMSPFLLFADYTTPQDARILEGALFEDFFSGLSTRTVEWSGKWWVSHYPSIARFRRNCYFLFHRAYAVPWIARWYDRLYGFALFIYRRLRRMFRAVFIFKNFIPRVF